MTQPQALRLADALDAYHTAPHHKQAAAELRRLHAELERCKQVCAATSEGWRSDTDVWKAQRDALLEALKLIVQWDEAGLILLDHHIERARAAIKQAEGENT